MGWPNIWLLLRSPQFLTQQWSAEPSVQHNVPILGLDKDREGNRRQKGVEARLTPERNGEIRPSVHHKSVNTY